MIQHTNRKHNFYKNSKGKAIRPKKGKSTFADIYGYLKDKGKKYDYLRSFSNKTRERITRVVKFTIYRQLK